MFHVKQIVGGNRKMITMLIGSQGSGKSVQAVVMARKYLKKGYTVYSNLYIKDTNKILLALSRIIGKTSLNEGETTIISLIL